MIHRWKDHKSIICVILDCEILSRTYFCCFIFTRKHTSIRPCFSFQIEMLKSTNSELKVTHNTFRDCRVRFFSENYSEHSANARNVSFQNSLPRFIYIYQLPLGDNQLVGSKTVSLQTNRLIFAPNIPKISKLTRRSQSQLSKIVMCTSTSAKYFPYKLFYLLSNFSQSPDVKQRIQ